MTWSLQQLLIPSSSDINYLVMDYLITNGYPAAASKFAVEANIQLRTDLESIQERVEIRTFIHSGNIQAAIEKINELNPQVRTCSPLSSHFTTSPPVVMIIQSFMHHSYYTLRGVADSQTSSVLSMNNNHCLQSVLHISHILSCASANKIDQILDESPALHFALLRLQLIELIRTCTSTPDGDISPALEFATAQLAPRAPTNPQFLEDLERTLALLIFPSDNLTPSLASLLDPSLRKDIAQRVNEAILQNQGARKEARLRNLVKLRAFAEHKARDAKKDIPDRLDIGLLGDNNDNTQSRNNSNNAPNNGNSQNGSGDTVMANNGDVDTMVA